jgi:dTDP-4-amino-4,6-dideoxygalactose transaminase
LKNINSDIWPYVSKQEHKIVSDVLKSNKLNYWTGLQCKSFEKEFSSFFGKKYGVSVCNASVALDVSLRSLNLPQGSEIIVTPRSYVSSASCVLNNNLKPIFADIDINSQNLSPKSIEKKINKKTKAIILVHLSGYPCEMDKIVKIAKKNKILIIEDCSQSHGAKYRNKFTGSFGDIAIWSFCNDKIMNTLGEGGMICVNNEKIYKKIWSLKDCGKNLDKIMNKTSNKFDFKWVHDSQGTNLRMTEVQAAVGRYQLRQLNNSIKIRQRNASIIYRALKNSKIAIIPKIPTYISHSFYRCYVLLDKKKINNKWSKTKMIKYLNSSGIECNSGSCPEIYREGVFRKFNGRIKARNNARSINQSTISFKVHPTISLKNMKIKSKKINEIFSKAEI